MPGGDLILALAHDNKKGAKQARENLNLVGICFQSNPSQTPNLKLFFLKALLLPGTSAIDAPYYTQV